MSTTKGRKKKKGFTGTVNCQFCSNRKLTTLHCPRGLSMCQECLGRFLTIFTLKPAQYQVYQINPKEGVK